MYRYFVIPLPGTLANESLGKELGRQGEGPEPQDIDIRGERRRGALECALDDIQRLKAMPDLNRDFEAWRTDDAGRWTMLYPDDPPKKRIIPLHVLERRGQLTRGTRHLKRRVS